MEIIANILVITLSAIVGLCFVILASVLLPSMGQPWFSLMSVIIVAMPVTAVTYLLTHKEQ